MPLSIQLERQEPVLFINLDSAWGSEDTPPPGTGGGTGGGSGGDGSGDGSGGIGSGNDSGSSVGSSGPGSMKWPKLPNPPGF